MIRKTDSITRVFEIAGVFILFYCLFFLIIVFVRDQDIRAHAVYATEMLTGKRLTAGNFLLYWLVNIFSFFSPKKIPSLISICLLIALAETLRYYLSYKYLNNIIDKETKNKGIHNFYTIIIALSLLFVFVIPLPQYYINRCFYMGGFAPNVWHNSTIIFVFPFSVLLFYLSYKQFVEYNTRRNYWITLLVFVNIYAKPSYFFVYGAIFPWFVLYRYKLKKEFWLSLIPVIVGSLFLLIEYLVIYKLTTHYPNDTSGIVFQPFFRKMAVHELWKLPVAFIFSLLFPITYCLFNLKHLQKKQLFWYVVMSELVAVMIFLFISESGVRANDGNFYWQIVPCTWLCFILAIGSLVKDVQNIGFTKKNILLVMIYCIHVLFGLVYYVRLFIVGTYL